MGRDKSLEVTFSRQVFCITKTRLVVIDGLFGCWGSNPFGWVADCVPNSLIVSMDPVAADYIGTEILNKERAKNNLLPRDVPLLEKSAQLGLGTNDPDKIELQELEIQAEVGKAVKLMNYNKTQWGRIKTIH